ncbi:DUF4157 domain-containing protein [Yinghuangia seranimata]|uniref:eCIS core domain-containing protein n=1 Tax=Yinghuangia seranimata TaxID=408067 RepID=UPI00248ACEAF|nr:DUF4157 domain-containing protein [Yinghuangia seranimata]MDI2131699.1 DUF4157 domain-containing protein [Yinghuangia seranimata]
MAASYAQAPSARTAENTKQKNGPCACGSRCSCHGGATNTQARRAPEQAADPLGMLHASSPAPLADPLRRALEPRFGTDLGDVRLHTGHEAAASARALGARAWTSGRDIAFGERQFAPGTRPGMRLLVHELSHVIQQRGQGDHRPGGAWRVSDPAEASERAADHAASAVLDGGRAHVAPTARSGVSVIARSPREGTAVTVDTLDEKSPPHPGAFGTWEGEVRRTTFATAEDAERELHGKKVTHLHDAAMNVTWDPSTCEVIVPIKVNVRGARKGELKYLEPGLVPADTTDANLISRVGDGFTRELETFFSQWYTVEWSGCPTGGKTPCVGKHMPIRVQVIRGGGTPDYDIAVSHLRGRSFVYPTLAGGHSGSAVLYGDDVRTWRHEAGHLALRAGDEYLEPEKSLQDPATNANPARVFGDDWSYMNRQGVFGDLSLLHRRHYSFATAFLNAVAVQNGWPCRAELRELARPQVAAFDISVGAGYSTYAGGSFNFDVGAGIALSQDRLRELNVLLSAHGQLLVAEKRAALLAGVRFGIAHTNHPSSGGFTWGGFGESGVVHEAFGGSDPTGAYLSGGLSAGYRWGYQSGGVGVLGVEGAATMRLDAPAEHWFRLGVTLGARF